VNVLVCEIAGPKAHRRFAGSYDDTDNNICGTQEAACRSLIEGRRAPFFAHLKSIEVNIDVVGV
jgi:hypothetical protein